MTHDRNRRWAAIAADMRDHHLVGMQVPPPKPADPARHAQAPFAAWADLILSAAYSEHEVRVAGRSITLARGEFLASRAYWAKRWNWGEQAVRGFFTRLAHDGMIAFCNQPTNQTVSVAKACNYESFQGLNGAKQPRRQPRSNQTATNDQPHTTRDTRDTKSRREGCAHANEIDDAGQDSADVLNLDTADKIDATDSNSSAGGQTMVGRTPTADEPRKPATAKRRGSGDVASGAILNTALADYNRAAEAVGFARCTTLSDAVAKTLDKRLRDIGQGDLETGARRFREALSAIPHDAFYAGRLPGTKGRDRYRLSMSKLLSTGSRCGDVLAQLCDLHDEHGPAENPTGAATKSSDAARFTSAWDEAQAEELATQRARRVWPPEPITGGSDAFN